MKVKDLFWITVIGACGLFVYDKVRNLQLPSLHSTPVAQVQASKAGVVNNIPVRATPTFQCDGRIHCSQMRSCEEANYFLKNCPGTKMDGDRDGVPCEQQWCN